MFKQFKIFQPYFNHLIYGITTREMGSFNDQDSGFLRQLSKLPTSKKPVFGKQLHGDNVIIISEYPNQKLEGDAFITNKSKVPLAVKAADCQGVLIFDPIKNVIAAVHSGWRSSVLNIIGKTIAKMSSEFSCTASDLLVGMSPSLGPCCAKFSDPESELPDFIHPFIAGDHVDFWSLSLKQLKESGVIEKNIEIMGECTKCNPTTYFSHRNGDNGRMMVFIEIL